MEAMSDVDAPPDGPQAGPENFECDFCGRQAPRVRRVALDRGYDRLQKPHPVRYACEACSAEKERERLAHPDG
jgi:hypothetical protein